MDGLQGGSGLEEQKIADLNRHFDELAYTLHACERQYLEAEELRDYLASFYHDDMARGGGIFCRRSGCSNRKT
jgi:hypothetical protein